jgi:hypothetical protein
MSVIRGHIKTSLGIGGARRSAAVSVASSGNNVAIAGTAGSIIVVLSYALSAAGNVTVRWVSEDGTFLSGPMPMLASTPLDAAWNPEGHFDTEVAGDDLILNLSGAVAVGGHITYTVIEAR